MSKLSDLVDVSATAPADNDVLTWDNALNQWVPEAATVAAMALSGLSDVDATAPSDNDVLTWDSATNSWGPAAASTSVGDLSDLGDVEALTPADGDVLTWDDATGKWINAASAVSTIVLSDITDVDPGTPADRDVLTYDESENKWFAAPWASDAATFYNVRNYASFAAAITAIGTTEATLLIPEDQSVTAGASITVPVTMTLFFINGKHIDVATGATLTINGKVMAAPRQIFHCAGTGQVIFSSDAEVYGDWWGTNTTPGTTDMTTAVQYALSSLTSGGTVKFLGATYLVTAEGATTYHALVPLSNTNILMDNKTVIKLNGTTVNRHYVFDCDHISNVYFRGGTILGIRNHATKPVDGQWGYGIRIHECSNITVRDTTSYDHWADSIMLSGTATTGDACTNILIDGNHFYNNRRQGISVCFADGVRIVNNYIHDINTEDATMGPCAGVDVEPDTGMTCKNVIIANNRIEDNTGNGTTDEGYGINFLGENGSVTYCTAANNTISGAGNYGILLKYTSHNIVIGNSVSGSVTRGIDVYESDYNSITGNSVLANGLEGIYLQDNSTYNLVANNYVDGNSQTTTNTSSNIVAIGGASYNQFVGNKCYKGAGANTAKYGILISGATSIGNSVRSNDLYLGGTTAEYLDSGTNTSLGVDNRRFLPAVYDVITTQVVIHHTSTVVNAAATTDGDNVFNLPANSILLGCRLILDELFAATGLTDLDITIGTAGDHDGIMVKTMNLTSDTVGTSYSTRGALWDGTGGVTEYYTAAATYINAYATAVGANLNTLTAGQVTLYFTYRQL